MDISHLKSILGIYKNVNQKYDEHREKLTNLKSQIESVKAEINSKGNNAIAFLAILEANQEVKKLERNLGKLKNKTTIGKYKKQLLEIETLKKNSGGYSRGYKKQIAYINKLILASKKLEARQRLFKKGLIPADKVEDAKNKLKALENQKPFQGLSEGVKKTFTPLNQLENRLERLKHARDGAFSDAQIKMYNQRIKNTQKEVDLLKRKQTGYTDEQKAAAKAEFKATADKGFSFLKSSVSEAAKLSDKYTEIQQSTGLVKADLKDLVGLSKNVTRTSTSDLLEYVKIASELGVGKKTVKHQNSEGYAIKQDKNKILGFAKSLDKLNLVLKNSYNGNGKAIANDLISIQGSFDQFKNNKDVAGVMLNIASALRALDNLGTNTFKGVASFVQDMAKSKIKGQTFQKSGAMGAVLGDAGIVGKSRTSSVNSLFALLGQKKGKQGLEKYVGKDNLGGLNQWDQLFALAQQLKGKNSSEITKVLQEFGMTKVTSAVSQDMVKTMIALAQGTDNYTRYVAIANNQLTNATVINEAFKASQQNLGGQLAIASRAFMQLKVTVGDMLAPTVKWLATQFLHLANFIQNHWSTIGPILLGVAIAVGILSMSMIQLQIAALPISTSLLFMAVGSGMMIAAVQTGNPILFLAAGIFLILKRRIWANTVAFRAFGIMQRMAAAGTLTYSRVMRVLNTVMKANPAIRLVLIFTTLIGIVSALYNRFEWFKNIVDGLFAALKGIVGAILTPFSKLFSFLRGGLTSVGNNMDTVSSKAINMKTSMEMSTQGGASLINGINGYYEKIDLLDRYKKGFKLIGFDGEEIRTKSHFVKKHLMTDIDAVAELLKLGVPLLTDFASATSNTIDVRTVDKKYLEKNTEIPKGYRRLKRDDGSIIDFKILNHKAIHYQFDDKNFKGGPVIAPLLKRMREFNRGVLAMDKKKSASLPVTSKGFNTDSKNNPNLKNGLTQVSASGVKEKNYNINIGKFVDGDFVVKTDTIDTAEQEVYDRFLSMFMRVINNAQV